jgi:hypothetical protein
MTILLLFLGWIINSFTIKFVNNNLIKYTNLVSWKLNILSIFISTLFWIIILNLISYELINESMNVYCSSSKEQNNLFEVDISYKPTGSKYSFDIRNLTDIFLIGAIGTAIASAVKVVPASVKATVVISTAIFLGAVALRLKVFNKVTAHNTKIEINNKNQSTSVKTSSENAKEYEPLKFPSENAKEKEISDNIDINSPFESSELIENLKLIVFSMEVLTALAIFGFILFILFLYISYSNINNINKSNNFLLNRLIKLVQKSGKIYTVFWGGFTLFNLSWNLYFTLRLLDLLNNLP